MQIPLLVFAKEPRAGAVKTRLTTHCTPQQAAEIANILLHETLAKVTQAWHDPIIVVGAPDIESPFFKNLKKCYPISLQLQGNGDLGNRLDRATHHYTSPFVVLGSDSPHIDTSQLQQAADILKTGSNAIGPSPDGGYYLLALQKAQSHLFHNINWSSAQVLEQTLARAKAINWPIELLTPLQDIDEWHHLGEAAKEVDALAKYLARIQVDF